MKRMTDAELKILWLNKPFDWISIARAIESAAYERATDLCESLSTRSGTAGEAAEAIRAMRDDAL